MPQMGYDMQTGTVVRWLKAEGAEVHEGDVIAEIETDKAVVEFECYASGILQRLLVPEGTAVPVGEPIAIVGTEGEQPAPVSIVEPPPAAKAPAQPAAKAPAPQKVTPPAAAGREVLASPVARRLALEHGLDLSQVPGTGPGGRITKEDVLSAVAARGEAAHAASALAAEVSRPQAVAAGKMPLSRMRQQIARVTVKSKQEKPHFYVTSDINMTRAMELRQQINDSLKDEGVRVSVNDLVIRACVEALKKYPKFNAFFHDDGIQLNEKINIGVAIAQEEGLIVPAILDCANKSLKEIAQASKELAERAARGSLHPKEYSGGTFSISNLGMFDVTSFVAIIHPPQSAVLAVGTVTKRPVVQEDQIVVAQMMTATLSADHRIVDGAEGARFIVEVKRLLENPLNLALKSF